jgi:hypothetical protein
MIFVFEVCQEEWKQTVSAVHWQQEKVRLPSSGPALSIISANERPFFQKKETNKSMTNFWGVDRQMISPLVP